MPSPLREQFTLQDDFPAVTLEAWQVLAEAGLRGMAGEREWTTPTDEGIDLQSLYTDRDRVGDGDCLGFPGFSPHVRGATPAGQVQSGWDIRPAHAHPDLTTTNQAIVDDLQHGATSVLIRLDAAAGSGLDPDARDAGQLAGRSGVMAYNLADLKTLLADVDLESAGISLEAGAAFLPAATMLAALWNVRGANSERVRGSFNADPLGTLSRDGTLPLPLDRALWQLAELATWTANRFPHVTAVGVDTSVYHDAGATTTQDIAYALATGVEYLRGITKAGLDVGETAGQLVFRVSLGTRPFVAIAKLRALRKTWSRVLQVSGCDHRTFRTKIHAHLGQRVFTRCAAHLNLLRNAVALFAAGLAGADIVTSIPFDAAKGLPGPLSRRLARNAALVLQEEAHLHRVLDPAGGSWFVDRLTDQVATKAWQQFQEIEREGGMSAAILNGSIASQLTEVSNARAADFAAGERGIIGVTEFSDPVEEEFRPPQPDLPQLRSRARERIAAARQVRPQLERVESSQEVADLCGAAAAGATVGQLAAALGFRRHSGPRITPLPLRRFAAPFERSQSPSEATEIT